jgi:hypothetical protein
LAPSDTRASHLLVVLFHTVTSYLTVIPTDRIQQVVTSSQFTKGKYNMNERRIKYQTNAASKSGQIRDKSLYPAFTRLRAIAVPMIPSPRNPILGNGCSLSTKSTL